MMIDALFLDQVDKKENLEIKNPLILKKEREKGVVEHWPPFPRVIVHVCLPLKNEMNNDIWLNFQKLYDEEWIEYMNECWCFCIKNKRREMERKTD